MQCLTFIIFIVSPKIHNIKVFATYGQSASRSVAGWPAKHSSLHGLVKNKTKKTTTKRRRFEVEGI